MDGGLYDLHVRGNGSSADSTLFYRLRRRSFPRSARRNVKIMGEFMRSVRDFRNLGGGRTAHQYNACVTEGIHYIVSQYDEGATFGKIIRYASTPGGGAIYTGV